MALRRAIEFFPRNGMARAPLELAMHLLLSTIALRPYVYRLSRSIPLHLDSQFRFAHHRCSSPSLTYAGRARLRMVLDSQRLSVRPLSLH